jgi:hypothetical protein
VLKALRAYVRSRGGTLTAATREDGEPHELLIVSPAPSGHMTVQYPGDFFEWDEASECLPRELDHPVFSLHIHDGDLWMYRLFVRGNEVVRFNPIPDYWAELEEEERSAWEGNANVLAKHWPGAKAVALRPYLKTWDLDDEDPPKAHPDDEFGQSDWQLVDFMRRLGLAYAVRDDGSVAGRRYVMRVPER